MNAIIVSLLVVLCIFVAGIIGMQLHRLVPRTHMTKDTQDVIRLGIGMISVLASLVLGLLIATAKSSYDTTDQAVRNYAAEIALLNETFRDYGGNAAVPRNLLRAYTETLLHDIWPADGSSAHLNDQHAEQLMERVREAVRALRPVDAGQTWLRDQALTINVSLLRDRWLLIGEQGQSISPVVLGILVSWIAVIFMSFGFNAPRNGTIIVAFLICALAIGGSIFLIMEMDTPLSGVLQISSWPLQNVLAQMNW